MIEFKIFLGVLLGYAVFEFIEFIDMNREHYKDNIPQYGKERKIFIQKYKSFRSKIISVFSVIIITLLALIFLL